MPNSDHAAGTLAAAAAGSAAPRPADSPGGQQQPRAQAGQGAVPGSRAELLGLVAEAIARLSARGIARDDLEPLHRLREAIGGLAPSGFDASNERRRNEPASEVLLARACAIIDLFILAGATPEEATQAVTRQLNATGVRLPEGGGDPRAWKRLVHFRKLLLHGSKSHHAEAREAYEDLKKRLAAIPAEHRVELALAHHLWDRRRAAGRAPSGAAR